MQDRKYKSTIFLDDKFLAQMRLFGWKEETANILHVIPLTCSIKVGKGVKEVLYGQEEVH